MRHVRKRLEDEHVDEADQYPADGLFDSLPRDVEHQVFQVEAFVEADVDGGGNDVDQHPAGETDQRAANERVLGEFVEVLDEESAADEEADEQVGNGCGGEIDPEVVLDQLIIIEDDPVKNIGQPEHPKGRDDPPDQKTFAVGAHVHRTGSKVRKIVPEGYKTTE